MDPESMSSSNENMETPDQAVNGSAPVTPNLELLKDIEFTGDDSFRAAPRCRSETWRR